MTRMNPMTGQPITETTEECVEETSFEPSQMVENAQGCELVKDELIGNTLSFRMVCAMEGTQTIVDGRYQNDGKTGKGNMKMTMTIAGREVSMDMDWSAKRLGDC